MSDGAVAREPSARTTFGIGSASGRPGLPQLLGQRREVDPVGERLDLELTEAGHDARPSMTETSSSASSATGWPSARSRTGRRRVRSVATAISGCLRANAVTRDRAKGGGSRRAASKWSSSRTSSAPSVATGSLTVHIGPVGSPVR